MRTMRCLLLGVTLAHLLTLPAAAQSPEHSTSNIKFTLSEPSKDDSKPIYEALQKSTVIPEFIDALGDMFIFPRPLEIRGQDCDESNYPSPSTALPIRLCYGLIRQTALTDNGMPDDAQNAQVVAAALFSVLNYLSPVLASQFDLKVGDEDRAALSELAGVLALSVGDALKDDALEDLARTAQDIAAAEENQEIPPYWILSGFTKAQANTIACMIYGSDPARFADLSVDDAPSSEAESCSGMFAQKMEFWSSLLDAHLKK